MSFTDQSWDKHLEDMVYETKLTLERLKDYPLYIKTFGVGMANASRGLKLYRKLESIQKEAERSETSKFAEYVRAIQAPAKGFIAGFFNRMTEQDKQLAAKLTGEIMKDMFEAGNRQAQINREMRKLGEPPIAELRKIADPEVKLLRSSMNSDIQKVFDRHLELPEQQALEVALMILEREEQ